MTFLQDFHAFWLANLNTILPAASVFTTYANPDLTFPFATISIVSSVPNFTTCTSFIEETRFQVSIFHSQALLADNLAAAIDAVLDHSTLGANYLTCLRQDYILLMEPDVTLGGAWHGLIEYTTSKSATLAQ